VPPSVIEGIARYQQGLQRDAYAQACQQAEEWIVEDGEGPAGRLVLDRRPDGLRVVDLSIAPRARRRGHARAVLLALQDEAGERGQALALRVRADNTAARALYAALGFTTLHDEGASRELRWRLSQKE
jgi:ribosomal protein S18 acetylase RimI-like enzyme